MLPLRRTHPIKIAACFCWAGLFFLGSIEAQAKSGTARLQKPFVAHFTVTNGHSPPLILELKLGTFPKEKDLRAFAMDSRIDPQASFQISEFSARFLANEVRVQQKVFERWKPTESGVSSAECNERLKLMLEDGPKKGTWDLCVDLTETDPRAVAARSWLAFVDQSLQREVHLPLKSERMKRFPKNRSK